MGSMPIGSTKNKTMAIKKKLRYAFSDLIIDENINVQKYVMVYDINGNRLGEVECYFVDVE